MIIHAHFTRHAIKQKLFVSIKSTPKKEIQGPSVLIPIFVTMFPRYFPKQNHNISKERHML